MPLFAAALFLSALLLFAVQPMFTKMVLPVLGGSPAVWSIALVFFQALLLAGYCYAHLLARYASTGAALALHLALMLGAGLTLPIAIPAGWTSAPADGEAFWLLGLFAVSVGLPFFALAANGPLLQAWFSRSGHPRAADPYFLYAASNVGSFTALVAYPLAVEPLFRMQEQTAGWFMGFAALAVLIGGCGLLGGARPQPRATAAGEGATAATAPARWRERAGWVGLAFVPSGLLVAVTAHISTDIAAAPLLWVVPLALFLLTFVLAFRDKALVTPAMLARLQVWGTALALMTAIASVPLSLGLALHLALFFVNAMLCHGALYRRRPAATRLTEFYVCMSLGGVLGGIACALLAPQLFSRVLEYPMLLVAALFCRPGFFGAEARAWVKEAGRAALVCMIVVAAVAAAAGALLPADSIGFVLMAILAVLLMAAWRTPHQVAPTALAALIVAVVAGRPQRRERAVVLRRPQADANRRRTLPHAVARHHHPRRRSGSRTTTAPPSPGGRNRRPTTPTRARSAPPSPRSGRPAAAGSARSRRSGSAPAASPATSRPGRAGASSRSTARCCGSRATPAASASSPNAHPTCPCASATRASRSPASPAARRSSCSTPSPRTRSRRTS